MKPSSSAERWQQVEAIFHQVIEAPSNERHSLATQLAGHDSSLLKDVLSLLEASTQAEEFLEDSEAISTSFTKVVSRWQDLAEPGSSVVTGPNSELVTKIDASPELAAALSLPVRATVSTVREFLSKARPELRIIDQVGEGAAGIVFKAIDEILDRFVAVKVLHRDWATRLGGDALSREAVAASLSSDHVVRVYEISTNQSPMLFILMEWIDGPSLREHLSQCSALNAREAARFALQIASGLAAAQRRNIVHGDIKPANVMLEPLSTASTISPKAISPQNADLTDEPRATRVSPEGYRAKLTDFGLARRVIEAPVNQPATEGTSKDSPYGSFAGTPAYASPEQLLHGHPANLQTDVWAVGATLYHMLCGVPPYTGLPHAIASQMRQGAPVSPRQLDPRIPRDLESICMKALNSAANQRYATAQELVDDLNRFLDGLPVQARPVRWPGKLIRLIQRRPLAAALVAGLFFALSTGAIVSNYYRLRAEDNLKVAEKNSEIASEERDNALTVINLLRSMISSGDTHYGNPDIKVIEALAGLEKRLKTELASKPGIEAEVRSSLGTMYFSVAAYEDAFKQFQRAIELRGIKSVDTALLNDRIESANTLRWLYRPEEAMAAALDAAKAAEDVLGKSHKLTLYAKEVLAGCHRDNGQLDNASELLQQVIQASSHDQESLRARSGLASVLIDQGKNAEAEAEVRNLISLRQQLGINDLRESVLLESNLGVALAEQGKIKEAIQVQQACAERAATQLGRAHDLTLSVWSNFAESLRRHGESERALAINEELWTVCRAELGKSHSKTLDFAESVILGYVRKKQFDEALRLVDTTIQEVSADLSQNDDWHHKLAGIRCAALTGLGRAEEAIPIFEQVVQHFETKLGRQATLVLMHKNNFGLTLIEAGQFQRAEEMFRELIAGAEATERQSLGRSLKRNYGLALLRSGHEQEARDLLTSVYQESIASGEIENANKCQEYLSLIPAINTPANQ
jgi:eukaryotic-like serine/threonine-protein kinase